MKENLRHFLLKSRKEELRNMKKMVDSTAENIWNLVT